MSLHRGRPKSALHIQLDALRERWAQEQAHFKPMTAAARPASPVEPLTEAEVSSTRACLEAMVRIYRIPTRSVCYYLQEGEKTVQAWKRGLAPPTRKAYSMLWRLVAELERLMKSDRE